MLKAWHIHGNMPHGGANFYPLLAEVGKAQPSRAVFPAPELSWKKRLAYTIITGEKVSQYHR